ncbi:MAG: hypothetical protein LQ349_007175 [Xanthoria aureola]|nr:MAG: hypothetical protein LQ349_007175 [Xanthoria aureola]
MEQLPAIRVTTRGNYGPRPPFTPWINYQQFGLPPMTTMPQGSRLMAPQYQDLDQIPAQVHASPNFIVLGVEAYETHHWQRTRLSAVQPRIWQRVIDRHGKQHRHTISPKPTARQPLPQDPGARSIISSFGTSFQAVAAKHRTTRTYDFTETDVIFLPEVLDHHGQDTIAERDRESKIQNPLTGADFQIVTPNIMAENQALRSAVQDMANVASTAMASNMSADPSKHQITTSG